MSFVVLGITWKIWSAYDTTVRVSVFVVYSLKYYLLDTVIA